MINRTQNHCCHAVRYGWRALLVACLCAATLRADESKSLKVSLGETRTVSESLGIHWFPGLSRMLDGSLHVHIGVYPDAVRKSVADIIAITLRSTDLGRNWRFLREHRPPHGNGRELEHVALRDGTVLELPFQLTVTGQNRFVADTYRSRDRGKTFSEFFEAPVEFPAGLEPEVKGDEPGRYYARAAFFGPVVELATGELLAAYYGPFANSETREVPIRGAFDLPLIRYQELKLTATVRKCRVVLLKSENKGDSWRYFSTIAYDQESPGDGYTYEPAIAKLRNGDLLCILRSDYPGQPLYQCRSKDQGKTWSQPEKMGFNGVAPNIVVLDSGIAAVSFGRPGVHVALSDNHGQTWGHHMDIFTGGPGHVGPMIPGHASSPGTTGYTGLVEVTPNTLLLAYDHLGVLDLRTKETSLLNSIKTVEIRVERK